MGSVLFSYLWWLCLLVLVWNGTLASIKTQILTEKERKKEPRGPWDRQLSRISNFLGIVHMIILRECISNRQINEAWQQSCSKDSSCAHKVPCLYTETSTAGLWELLSGQNKNWIWPFHSQKNKWAIKGKIFTLFLEQGNLSLNYDKSGPFLLIYSVWHLRFFSFR